MVVEEGKPVGVLTRHDLLGFLSDDQRAPLNDAVDRGWQTLRPALRAPRI